MASEICFPLEMHLVLNFKTLLRFFWCPGHLKKHSWRCSIPAGWGPSSWVMAQHPLLSKTNNEIFSLCAGPWSESGEELLDKAGQLPVKIHFTLSQSSDRFWSESSRAKRGSVHSHRLLLLFLLETLTFLRVTLTEKAIFWNQTFPQKMNNKRTSR